MFDKSNRYMTKGIQQEIPLELQLFMWNCIDKLKEQENKVDYLQVFEITEHRADDIFYQIIEHSQEVPEYNKTYKVCSKKVVNAKVFVIDDETHSTMLLAQEY
ncbi:DUF960 domain-containing protein [Clostridium estertheticum]|uniref:DUF960 domain-containing protein n=1 Tax=Clostridium estertheticum subsp. estertheticum TaxID=1552 RepID=A0A1J0GDB6_9CLOT|nr:DUF960 domain-containing protein [Clostridium estertheticum]APC38886.1 hypothetical protein A7L45_01790 [Clostridium estertheticum subsp. estertheticum]MBZ9615168.1 DUF960 domain-containing protein [Clostridium estertheticum subsp. laramiense]WAG75062.1 DUF960 domain-containing protein [Clostridium estertheticum]